MKWYKIGFAATGVFASTCSLISCQYNMDAEEKKLPNIVLINIDDMGWRDVGFMGSEYYETPNLDALAAQGMIFTNAYAAASNCAPSRASMFTGQWNPRHGVYTVDSSERGKSEDRRLIPTKNTLFLPEDQFVFSMALKNAGYVTCHAGKWHVSEDPTDYGFDVNIGGWHSGNPGSYYPPYTLVPLEAPSDDYYLTDLIMDKTLEFLETVKGQPFFLNYSPYAVHTPIQPVRDLLPKYEDKPSWKGQNHAEYATMVENLDTQIGRLITKLNETGKIDNTFILFISDNGGHLGYTTIPPLRSGKGSYYEGGIRVPMFAWWNGHITENTISDVPVTMLDFFPTFLELAGIEKPEGKRLDGQSLLPLLTGSGTVEERPLFWHFPVYLQTYLGERDPTQDPLFRTRPGSAVRFGDWKLIQYFEYNDMELYNLEEDIGEMNNLATVKPDKLKELLGILESWREETGAPVPTEMNPDYKGDIK